MKDVPKTRQITLNMLEATAQQIAEQNNWPINKAREFVHEEVGKRWAGHVKVYEFLRSKNPDIVKMESDREGRIQKLMIEADIPRTTAAAVAVVSDLKADRDLRRFRNKQPMFEAKLRDLVGLAEPVPDDILKLLSEAEI